MRLRSLGFAGYRSFSARSPASPDRPLQQLAIAPLTILLGKNNSGKSTTARLLRHVLLALSSEGSDPFPVAGAGKVYARSFRDLQHQTFFLNPIDLRVGLRSESGADTELSAQLIQLTDADDEKPIAQNLRFDGQAFDEQCPRRGLLPDVPGASEWRQGARDLVEASCYLGPVREPVNDVYDVERGVRERRLPEGHVAIAEALLVDAELRAAVGDWMAEHLDGWRVEVQQTLDMFRLLARRGSRESNLADTGQGVQQVLPVAVLCCWRKLGRGGTPFLDVVEQPELHLHDAAHAALGDLLLSAVAGGRGGIVVETHSEALVLRVRRRVAEGLSPSQINVVYVDDAGEGSRLREIPLRADGEVEWWPEGVFSESFVEVKAIRRAQRKHVAS